MSKEIVSNVSYPVAPGTTVLVSIDYQFGFGAGSWEQVPHADAAVENFRTASRAWRQCGGAVMHVQTAYTPERAPSGRITDFEPGIAGALAAGTKAAKPYPDLIADGDLVVYKTTFSAVLSSDLPGTGAHGGDPAHGLPVRGGGGHGGVRRQGAGAAARGRVSMGHATSISR